MIPGTPSMRRVTSRRVPPTYAGWLRIAVATRCSAVPGGARATARNARARPSTDSANSGAPHPSIPVCATSSPASPSIVARSASCSGWSGRRYVRVGQPFATQVASIAACLPEQFIASGVGSPPARR